MQKQILNFKKEQSGFSLLELLLVVGVAAILLLAGIATYRLITSGNNLTEANRLLVTIKQQTQRLYQGQTSYGNATDITPILVNAGAFPASALTPAGTARTPWNTAITVTGATANFEIVFENLPRDACIGLGRLDIANDPDFVSVEIGSTAFTTLPTPTDVNDECADGVDITWTFF